MRRQKGQAVVEFALVLPFFLLLVLGIIFAGLLYSDYLTLSNLARESARAASIQGESSYGDIKQAAKDSKGLLTDLYSLEEVNIETVDSSVKVTLTTKRQSFPGAGFVKYMLPDQYQIVYSMYKEPSS